MFDYIIVGAGLAGSVLAERISNVLGKRVLIIEKREHIGGNCYDEKSNIGITIHKYGPHIFHTNYQNVWDYISKFTEWNSYKHKVLVAIKGIKVPLPFNINSIYLVFPKSIAMKLENKLVNYFGYGKKISILELKELDDSDFNKLSNYVYENIFVNYTLKQWGLNPDEIENDVISRVPIHISRDNKYFTDKYQGIPKNGYASIFEKMLNNDNIKILLNTDFKKIIKFDFNNKKIFLNHKEFHGKLIFTGMIDELMNYRFGFLKYRSLDLRIEKLDKDYYQEVAVVNYPNENKFTRITEFKYFNPVKINKTIIMKEYPKNYKVGMDIPYYPMFTSTSRENYKKYLGKIKNFTSIVLIGRLAEYKYYDMDDTIKRALDVFEKLI